MQNIRNISFEDNDCRFTCSAGVCYLPENISGYSYDQLFENADIALYKAKERGRNCYVYCDSLQHFTMMSTEHEEYEEELDARYFQNDIVATAFEIFEKTSNFDAAVNLLMRVIGTRVGLDRITVIRADIKNQEVYSDYQWNKKGIPKVLKEITPKKEIKAGVYQLNPEQTLLSLIRKIFLHYLIIMERMGSLFFNMMIWKNIHRGHRNF